MNVFLIRFAGSDHGSRGIWVTEGFKCRTMELPWRDNRKSISCIPDGTYPVRIRTSRKYGNVYHIKDVPDRSWVLAHAGNWAGDKSKNLRSNSEGCVLLGLKHADIYKQRAVTLSRVTLQRWMAFAKGEDFTLHVHTMRG